MSVHSSANCSSLVFFLKVRLYLCTLVPSCVPVGQGFNQYQLRKVLFFCVVVLFYFKYSFRV